MKEIKSRKSWAEYVFPSGAGIGALSIIGEKTSRNPNLSILPIWFSIEINDKCNLKCNHCIYEIGERKLSRDLFPVELLSDRLEEAINDNIGLGLVSLSGKEPTLSPERVYPLADILEGKDLVSILMTNGIDISNEFLNNIKNKIDYIEFSLDGPKNIHDRQRGNGNFNKTLKNIKKTLDKDFNVSIISTTTNDNYQSMPSFVNEMNKEFGNNIKHTINLYYGLPKDPKILKKENLLKLVDELSQTLNESRLLFLCNYSHYTKDIFNMVGKTIKDVEYDQKFGVPILNVNKLKILMFNLAKTPLALIRMSPDGYAHLCCNYLALSNNTSEHAVGDFYKEGIKDILKRLDSGYFYSRKNNFDKICKKSDCLEYCGGGDRYMGYLLNKKFENPFCEKLINE